MRDERAGADHAVFADLGPVEHNRAHPDDGVVADGRAVHDGVVAHRDVIADSHVVSRVRVDRGVVLDVAAVADEDVALIAADDRVEPDAGVDADSHVALDGASLRLVNGLVNSLHRLRAPF